MDLRPTECVDAVGIGLPTARSSTRSRKPFKHTPTMSFLNSYQSKRLLGFVLSNSQSIRWPTQGRILRRAAEEFRRSGHRALDVGCGGGSYAIEHHLRHGTPTMLCDYSEELLSMARRQVAEAGFSSQAEFTRCSAEELPFPEAQYDFIECMEVLEHLQHPETALAEFRRVAKPGARLVLSVPHPPEWFHNEGHVVEGYAEPEITRLVTTAGWKVIRIEYCMLILTRLIIAIQQVIRVPLPLVPIARLENLVPRKWRKHLLPYDIMVVAELPT